MFHDQNLNLFLPFLTIYMFLHRPQLFHERLPRSPSRVYWYLEGTQQVFPYPPDFDRLRAVIRCLLGKGGDVVLKYSGRT